MSRDDLPTPRRALAIGAHPDDIEFGCGATLAKWADAGCEVHLLVLTDGSKGTWDADADTAALVATRIAEQHSAAAVLGAVGVHFLGRVDGELRADRDDIEAVCAVIRETRPDVVLTHDPWKRYRLHPDHHRAGTIVLEAVVAARDPHFFREQGLERHRPEHVLLFEAEVEDHVEAIDSTFERKVAALLEHRSQWVSTHGISTDVDADTQRFRSGLLDKARAAGDPDRLAEAFKLIDGI